VSHRSCSPRSSRCQVAAIGLALALVALAPSSAAAAEKMYFPAVDNVTDVLVNKIRAETVRVDISCWYLTEHSISIALINKYKSGVPVRLLGDRGSMFEIDPRTKLEFYWLANQGLPIRLRYEPTWYPEINHWKATIFVGQNLVAFGSANYTPFELANFSTPDRIDYKDESVLLTDDPSLVKAFKTKFDRFWNDTTPEAESIGGNPPYFKNWEDACATEFTGNCADYGNYVAQNSDLHAPMVINTQRLELDYPTDLPDMVWGQGTKFNDRLVQEINRENNRVDFVIYRLTVDNITQALLDKFRSGVPVRLIVEPNEYLNRKWPEFWLTHANIDKLYAAGIAIKQRTHNGLTHMKALVTSNYATNGSSNFAAAWQRDHNYFIPAATKPATYQAVADRVQGMWANTRDFADFVPQPPDPPTLASPGSSSSNVPTTTSLVWNIAPFAVSYDVYLGTSQANMTLAGNVPAQLVNSPPSTYSWTPASALQPGTTYFWKVISRTNATAVTAVAAVSPIWAFTTAGPSGPPAPPAGQAPSDGATGVSISPTLSWLPGSGGTTYSLAFGTTNPPPQVATSLSASSYSPGTLAPNTTYFWRVTAVSSGGTALGPIWSFTTASAGGGGSATDVVLYAADVTTVKGTWTKVVDQTAAGGVKLSSPDNGIAALAAPESNPANYFEVPFSAVGGTRYRVWLRIHPINDLKWNDSAFVQFSDSVNISGNPVYRMGSAAGLMVNLWTCAECQTSGWGWQRNAYWLADTGDVWFPNSGTHTLRVQIREDGIEIDQIVISPTTYATNGPGPVSNDSTIVPKAGQAPSAPALPSPANGATGVGINPTLVWSAPGATSYDVSFGTTNPPPPLVSGISSATYTPTGIINGTTYHWQIVARNAQGSTTGAVWSFSTVAAAPGTPTSPAPADGSTGVATNVTLTWAASGATTYDVLFGTSDPPDQIASGVSSPSYTPVGLIGGATYFWQIVAHNSGGANQGPRWSFTTTAPPSQPPAAPSSPTPSAGATAVPTDPTLTWTAPGATSYDVLFGPTNPPTEVAIGITSASHTLSGLANSAIYFWQIVARNAVGTTRGPVWSFTTAAPPTNGNVVIYASDAASIALHGTWRTASDPTSPLEIKLMTPDNEWASTDAPPATLGDYIDVTFNANAGTPYTLWLRLQALARSKYNDAVWVQFSDALVNGLAVYPLNSTSALLVNLATDAAAGSLNGWGWTNGAYWLAQPRTVAFATSGTHTLRIQVREDGVQLDQIVLSPSTYLNAAPGPPTSDAVIVQKP
jgi:hypothetical protein